MFAFHVAYLVASILLVVIVAGTLYKNGRAFLLDCFGGNEAIADAVNRMLVVGFIVSKIAFAALFPLEEPTTTGLSLIVPLLEKLGAVVGVLGAMHMFNLLMLTQYRQWRIVSLRSKG